MFHLTNLLTRSTPAGAADRARGAAAAVLAVALSTTALTGCSRDADGTDAPGANGPEASGSPTPREGQTDGQAGEQGGEQGDEQNDERGGDTAPVDLTPDEVDDVEKGTDDYLDDRTDALEKPKKKPKPEDHPRVTGDALEDLFNQVAEFQNNGWRMDGSPAIVWQRVVRRTNNPDGVVVRVCVDNSDVRVLDRNGDEVPNSRPAEPRTVNVLTLLRDGTDWTVSEQRLARKPDC